MKNIIEDINEVQAALNGQSADDLLIIQEALKIPILKSYIYQKLSNQFDAFWFRYLYDNNAFDFLDIPKPLNYVSESGDISKGFTSWEGCFVIWEASKYNEAHGDLTIILLNLIESYIVFTEAHAEDKERNFTIDYYFCQFIFLLPLEAVRTEYIAFCLNFGMKRDRSILSADLTDKFFKKTLNQSDHIWTYFLLELFFDPIPIESSFKITSAIDDFYLESFVKRIPADLFKALGVKVVDWALNKIKVLSQTNFYHFLKANITSLEPDAQNSLSNGINFSLLNLVLGLLKLLKDSELISYIPSLLESDQPIIKRIGLYFLDKRYDDLNKYFWKIDNPLNFQEGKLELFRLLKNNCKKFDQQNVSQVTNWIKELKVDKRDEESDIDHHKYTAYKQLEWLIALQPIRYRYNDILVNYYNDLKEITENQEPAHPGYDSYFSIRPGGDFRKTKRLSDLSVSDVLNLLINPKSWDGYNSYGLQQDLRNYVINSPTVVFENLSEFLHLPLVFLYSFLDGIEVHAEKDTLPDLEDIIAYLSSLVKKSILWEKEDLEGDRSGVLGKIAWVISAIAQKNENNLTSHENIRMIEILIEIDNRYQKPFNLVNNNKTMEVINSTRGKSYEAMIKCSLREIKLKSSDTPFWINTVKSHFTKRLSDGSNLFEFYWTLGLSIPTISYMDINWIVAWRSEFFNLKNGQLGEETFGAYLVGSGQLYTNLFKLFYDLYLDGIEIFTELDNVCQRLIEHIVIAFLINEDGAEKLIGCVLKNRNKNQIKYLIDRVLFDDNLIKNDNQLLFLWNGLLEIISTNDDNNISSIVANTISFLKLVKNPDKRFTNLFQKSVNLGGLNTRTYELIKLIESRIKSDSEFWGNFLLILISNHSINLSYESPNIMNVITKLYEYKETEMANKIAFEAVFRKNFDAVNIYNQYNLA